MSTLTFLPWVAPPSAQLPRTGSGRNRPTVNLSVTVVSSADGAGAHPSVTPTLSVLGPGDVVGIGADHILRTYPADGATGVETTIFPCVEFDVPALPWLFNTQNYVGLRITPWLCLIVVRDMEGVRLDRASGRLSLSTGAATTELPQLKDAWAWAHAQYGDALAAPTGTSAAAAMANGAMSLSRLMCPRVLNPDSGYFGCLVPTTDVGQRAGLGAAPADTDQVYYGWPTPDSTGTITLPVYHSFSFTTGLDGDFKSLALKLTHRPDLPLDAHGMTAFGDRQLEVSTPGIATVWPVPMPTILSVPLHAPANPAPPDTVRGWLKGQYTQDFTSPHLTVPLYGAVQAGLSAADIAAGTKTVPTWITDVSTNPRLRVAAGYGAQLVTAQRERLVAAAFDQLGSIRPVNDHFSRAQLARAVGDRQVNRHLSGHDDLATVQLLGPHLRRWPGAGSTAVQTTTRTRNAVLPAALGGDGGLLPAMASAAYRRISRPRGPLARRTTAAGPPPGVPRSADLLAPVTAAAGAVARRVLNDFVTPATAALADGFDPLRALAPAVSYPVAIVDQLIASTPDMVLPGAGRIPMNTALTLVDNPDVIAAYMIGLNYEVQRLLQWRDVPTDRTASPFQYFWAVNAAGHIGALDSWTATQSVNDLVGLPRAVLAVRGELFVRYPRTTVYAALAPATGFTFPPAGPLMPTFSTIMPPDLRLFVFDQIPITDPTQLKKYFFLFQEQPSETRFGTDTFGTDKSGMPLKPPSGLTYWTIADIQIVKKKTSIDHAGTFASDTRMPPVVVAINAGSLLPQPADLT